MKKLTALLIVLSLVLLATGGCGTGKAGKKQTETAKQAPKNVTVRVAALKGPTAVGMVKLFEDKPALGQNIAASYQVVESPDLLMARLASGEVDLATLPTNLAAILYNKGMPYQLAAISSWGVNYVVSNGVVVNSLADLKGKKVYVFGKGTTPDVVLRYVLSRNGIDAAKDVELDYTLGQVELAQSLIAGRVSLAVLPEPWVTQALKGNPKVKMVVDLQEEWQKVQGDRIPLPQTCLVVKKDLAQKQPEAVGAFLEAYAASLDWVNRNPAAAGALVQKHGIGMKAAVAEAAIPRCNFRYEDAAGSREAVNSYLQVLFNFSPQTVGGKLPDNAFYYQK